MVVKTKIQMHSRNRRNIASFSSMASLATAFGENFIFVMDVAKKEYLKPMSMIQFTSLFGQAPKLPTVRRCKKKKKEKKSTLALLATSCRQVARASKTVVIEALLPS